MGAIGDVDDKTVELLELVSRYEQLCNDRLRTDFIDGFFTLGRANYNSGSVKKYGVDSLDMRPHEPSVTVEVGDQWRVVKDTEKTEKSAETKKKEEITNNDHDLRELQNEKSAATLRNRKRPEKEKPKKTEKPEKPEKIEKPQKTVTEKSLSEPKKFNPLHQFGGLVPYQLRQSQLHFTAAIELAVERHNLAVRIEKLVAELESNL